MLLHPSPTLVVIAGVDGVGMENVLDPRQKHKSQALQCSGVALQSKMAYHIVPNVVKCNKLTAHRFSSSSWAKKKIQKVAENIVLYIAVTSSRRGRTVQTRGEHFSHGPWGASLRLDHVQGMLHLDELGRGRTVVGLDHSRPVNAQRRPILADGTNCATAGAVIPSEVRQSDSGDNQIM